MIVSRSLLFVEGIIFLLLGLFALSQPYVATLSVELMMGSILVIAGVVQGYRSLTTFKDPVAGPLLIASAFSLIVGILLLAYPLTGILTLTLLVSIFFLVDGIAKLVSGFQIRPVRGWGWLALSGLLSLILAFLIFQGWPSTAAWLIGFYLGVYWIFLGASLLTLSYYSKA